MNYSTSTQFVNSRRIGIYEPAYQFSSWADDIKNGGQYVSFSSVISDADRNPSQSDDTSHGILGHPGKYEREANKYNEKVQRRLAQNREAARKSRLRKKAYVQQLESSRLKLIQLEQELEQARQQGALLGGGSVGTCPSGFGVTGTLNSGIAAFEVEYANWVEEQNKQICELRNSLNTQISDVELGILVESGLGHYSELFGMKAKAAKADVFYVISGMFKTSAERFFLWIGGFRPSEVLKVLLPHFVDLSDEQLLDVYNLKQSCQQAEDALTQGMDKLQQMLTDAVVGAQPSNEPPMSPAMEKLEALVSFVNQADHLRQETLQQMYRILTARQAARGLLALGEYFQRLRALSSIWDTRRREPG